MNYFSLHPDVYSSCTAGTVPLKSLLRMLEKVWVHDLTPGQGTLYIISGFGMYNGGVRFFDAFEDHIKRGGRNVCFFAGSTSQKLTSKQLVEEMLNVGAEVHVVNRKRLLHAKCYGVANSNQDLLIVTSGNFTGPGLSLNGEAAILLDNATTAGLGFSWSALEASLMAQPWNHHIITLSNRTAPGWLLLYDEQARGIVLDNSEEVTLLVTLGHSDTVRILAPAGTTASAGTQYFWLSRDSYGFFPPLTIRNRRRTKSTFSATIKVHYVPLRVTRQERVTFEAYNNLDFRLGTGTLRNTGIASPNDLAAISRISESEYEMRIFKPSDPYYAQLRSYAVNLIGHKGKQYGYIDNDDFTQTTGIRLPSIPRGGFP